MRWIPLSALALALSACGNPDDTERLARALFDAVSAGHEHAFINLHVRDGDMSPDGAHWICTRAGGVRPDEAWTNELRELFKRNRERFAALKQSGAPSFGGVTSATRSDTHVSDIRFTVTFGAKKLVGRIDVTMFAARGLVIVGNPGGIEFLEAP